VSAARPPGWYDDPSGDAALLRWWDGGTWTSVTRRRSPAEQPPTAAPDVLDSEAPQPTPGRRGWVLAALAAAVVALLLLTGLPGGQGDERLADPGPRPAELTPSQPAPTTPRVVSGRVVDRVARLSYDVLPGQWKEWDRDAFRGMLSTIGYYRITQEAVPNGETYWANVASGPVSPGLASRADLRVTATRTVDALAREYYPSHSRQQVAQRELSVDGAQAYLVRYRAVFDPVAARGYTAKSEEVAVLVVDTGADLPSVLYVSLPDTVRTLWPAVDGLLSSVRIVR
jgi:hypothetical protein